jgi:hypothetical protein
MKPASIKPVRCAIYTRVSTEQGLDQEFNSLDAQYDADRRSAGRDEGTALGSNKGTARYEEQAMT